MFDPKLLEGFATEEELKEIEIQPCFSDYDSFIYNADSWLRIQKLLVKKFNELGAEMLDGMVPKGRQTVRYWIVLIAPSVMAGLMMRKYPTVFNDDMDIQRVREICHLLLRAESHLEYMAEYPCPDMFPEIEYSPIDRAQYMTDEWMHDLQMQKKIDVYVNDIILHPRHYRYNKNNGEVIFMDHRILSKGTKVKTTVHKTESDFEFQVSKDRLPDWGKMMKEFNFTMPQGQPSGKTQTKPRLASTGMALYSDMEGWGAQYRAEQPEDLPETVKGNGRQVIIDNGKHKWPAPKQRKGHRKHG